MTPFIEVATIPEQTPLEAWAGLDGKGFDGCLFLSTGARQGGRSKFFRHDDRKGDHHWVSELETDAETHQKLRDGIDPETGEHRLWGWLEGPQEGQSILPYRRLGSTEWAFEDIPFEGNTVGGRGLAVNIWTPDVLPIFAGCSTDWFGAKHGKTFIKNPTWSDLVERTPGINWELEYDEFGRLWEFWHLTDGDGPFTLVDGEEIASPDTNTNQVAWFPVTQQMYMSGDQEATEAPHIKSFDGDGWNVVFEHDATRADKLVYVPRGPGELWSTANAPLRAAMTFSGGADWTVIESLPPVDTGDDTNSVTALGYYGGRIWILARDQSQGRIRVFREAKASTIGGGGGLTQIL